MRKLLYNNRVLHIFQWNEKECFKTSELANALEKTNDNFTGHIRNSSHYTEGLDYDILRNEEALKFKHYCLNNNLKLKMVQCTILYLSGLKKYMALNNSEEVRKLFDYCVENGIFSRDDDNIFGELRNNEVRIEKFQDFEVRYLSLEGELLFVRKDIGKILEVSNYYVESKAPLEHIRLHPIVTKSGATHEVYLINREGIIYLERYSTKDNNNFLRWLDELAVKNKVEICSLEETSTKIEGSSSMENTSQDSLLSQNLSLSNSISNLSETSKKIRALNVFTEMLLSSDVVSEEYKEHFLSSYVDSILGKKR